MIYARLQVEDQPTTPLASSDSAGTYDTAPRINGRVSVLDDSIARRAFDSVHLCLRGVLVTTIGHKSAIEDIITLTDIKTATEFKGVSSNGAGDTQNGRHADFYFQLPTTTSTANGVFRPLPLSKVFKGTVNSSQNSPLNDNRIISGECEVSYWIEAKFRRGGQQVGFLHRHVQVLSLYPHLRASVAKAGSLTVCAKPDLLTRCRFQKSPDLSVTFPESEMTVECDSATGKRHITLPLSAAINVPEGLPTRFRHSLTCVVEAKWQVNTCFSTLSCKCSDRSRASETVRKTTTASTQRTTIIFRPLPRYDERDVVKTDPADPFLVTSQLELQVPDALSQPSLSWKHLSRAYTLNLALHFRSGSGTPNYSLPVALPLSVTAYGSKADDAAFGAIARNYMEITSDDGEDEVLGLFGPPSIEEEHERTRPQRAATRTPPPPYFR
ncbi:hypothetical protein H2200_004373 [Cladophialophora chaetospira]|uniref:Uncharacterized protein n=1 Tax=Cladophialophora chaetospira TaxID=386627 RepID=A0AA38XD49_9EURO|nr:hypothetical protein H2200_004373 [Cladophialophora chaetospira]